jgi:hypothetical protein
MSLSALSAITISRLLFVRRYRVIVAMALCAGVAQPRDEADGGFMRQPAKACLSRRSLVDERVEKELYLLLSESGVPVLSGVDVVGWRGLQLRPKKSTPRRRSQQRRIGTGRSKLQLALAYLLLNFLVSLSRSRARAGRATR